MADIINTKLQLEELFWSVTTKIIGYDPALSANQDKVRIAWPTEGMPAQSITDNIAYIKVTELDSQINRLRNTYFSNKDSLNCIKNTEYTRVIEVLWTFYGPLGFDRADLIRHSIFEDQYKSLFNASHLYLITDVQTPVRIPEEFLGQWWDRTDFRAQFNEYIKRETTIPYIQSADITIKTDNNLTKNIHIQQ